MTAKPQLIGEIPVERRLRIPKAAAAELAARYRARELSEQRLVDFLHGLTLAKGLKVEDIEGFDNETNELILRTE